MYELMVDGYHSPLTARQIADLFDAGRLRKADPCRVEGSSAWRTVDEFFPLLKYDSCGSGLFSPAPSGRDRTGSVLDRSDAAGDLVRPMTSALKAGWTCVGIGLLVAWFFPLGHAFFSIAMITAIVAMCTHQVNRGLILLITSFAGIVLSILITFTLMLGVVGVAAVPVIKQVNAEMKRVGATQPRTANPLINASQQQQFATGPVVPSANWPALPAITTLQPSTGRSVVAQQAAQNLARTRAAEATQRAANDRTARERNIREADQRREVSRAKEQELERLQKSLDWWEAQIQKRRADGQDWRALEQQRDVALRQRDAARGR